MTLLLPCVFTAYRRYLHFEVLSKRSDFFRLFHFHGLNSLPITASRFFLAGIDTDAIVDVSLQLHDLFPSPFATLSISKYYIIMQYNAITQIKIISPKEEINFKIAYLGYANHGCLRQVLEQTQIFANWQRGCCSDGLLQLLLDIQPQHFPLRIWSKDG